MKRRIASVAARIERIGPRDRMALALMAVALAGGVEMLYVMPMHEKRQRVEQAMLADSQSQQSASDAVQKEEAARQTEIKRRSLAVQTQLQTLGMQQTRTAPYATFLAQAIAAAGVSLVSLKSLPAESINVTTGSDAAAPAAPAASARQTLYRQRAELTLDGSAKAVTAAVAALEVGTAPLRIERVLLRGTEHGVRASVTLTTLSTERAWLGI